ncbi:hypothetical protein [Streptacidiphilus carbonis]|uniref:hypothetical protein n=1 Tax=Streptacidiphilus carbonis TaxID=105422 RepID=UPI000A535E81|nr:hypothetical protein [Streptacidiphilus carbonis]
MAFLLYIAGVWAVATTPWTAAVAASAPAASSTTSTAPSAGPSPIAAPSSTAPTVPAVWTLSTLRNYLVAETNAKDPGVALADLQRITLKDPYVDGFCHPVAHEIGHAALARYQGNFAKAVSFLNDVCGSGYLHGVVEDKLQQEPDPATAVTTLCSPAQSASCIHGIGHGAMFVSHLDVAAAERMCDRFPESGQVVSCSEGIFMQLFEPDEGDPTALAKLPADKLAAEPQYPCAEQPAIDRSACYFYAPIYFLQTHDYTAHPAAFVQALDWCLKAPTSDARDGCSQGTGSRLMKYNIDRPVWTAAQCEQAASARQRSDCVWGMANYWNVNYGSRSAARTRLCPQLSGDAARLCRISAPGSSSAD